MRKKLVAILLAGVLTFSSLAIGCSDEPSDRRTRIEKEKEENHITPTKKLEPTSEPTKAPDKPNTDKDTNNAINLSVSLGDDYGDDFDAFLDLIFLNTSIVDSVSLHTSIEHPEKYGISLDYTLGGDEEDAEDRDVEFFDFIKTGLEHFKNAKLNKRQQLKYDLLSYELEQYEYSKSIKTDYIVGALSQNGNVLSNIQTSFAEYPLENEQDMIDFIEILKLIPAFIDDEIEYLDKAVIDDNLLLTQSMLDNAMTVADNLATKDPTKHVLYISFEINAKNGGIKDELIDKYLEKVADEIKDGFVPAIKKFRKHLDTYKSEVDNARGLANFEDGAEYYAYLLEIYVGLGMTPEEIYEYGLNKYKKLLKKEEKLITQNSGLYNKYISASSVAGDDPDEIMKHLLKKSRELFPDLGDIKWDLRYLDKRQENSMVTAYYMPPQLDNLGRKTIKINGSNITDEIDLYATLSHEGIPGHLYQDEYRFQSEYFDEMDTKFTYLGYQEGWAMYVEKLAYGWCLEDPDVAELYICDGQLSYLMYALSDIQINYFNLSKAEFGKWLSDLAGYDTSSYSGSMYNVLVSDPGVYPAYGFGSVVMDDTVQALMKKGISESDAYKKILQIGQVPFDVLWKELGIDNPLIK